jgi:hypothetical protein
MQGRRRPLRRVPPSWQTRPQLLAGERLILAPESLISAGEMHIFSPEILTLAEEMLIFS